MCNGTFDDDWKDDMNDAHFVGYTQNGMHLKPLSCPMCLSHLPSVEHVEEHFSKFHSYSPWKKVELEDHRFPGVKFHFMVNDLPMQPPSPVQRATPRPLPTGVAGPGQSRRGNE